MRYLSEYFNQYLSDAYRIPHDEAVRREVENLQPHFQALSAMLNARNDRKNTPFQPSDFDTMFTAMARENGSLIRSSFIITDAESFIDYAQNDCSPYYNGEGHTCYPPAASLDKRQKMGFAQLLRLNSDTRITQPVLSLNNDYIDDAQHPQTQQLISTLESLYSLTTHDWLHHMTMYVVSNHQVVKANRFAPLKDPMHVWNSAMDAPDSAYKQSAYEAWAVLTHASLLHRSAALSAALTKRVEQFITQLHDRGEYINAAPNVVCKDNAYKELAYLFHLGASSLRYVVHPSAPLFTPIYDAFDRLMENEPLRCAMGTILKNDTAACSSSAYKAHLAGSSSVTTLFDDTPAAARQRAKVDEYTAAVFDMMRAHYAPSSKKDVAALSVDIT